MMEEWNGTNQNDLLARQSNDQDLYDTFLKESRFWIQRVLLPIVVIVGVIGNGLTIIVLTRPKMRSSTNTYLTALAISDLLYLVFVFTISLEHYPGIHSPDFYYYWEYHRIGLWLADATDIVFVLFTTLIMASSRYKTGFVGFFPVGYFYVERISFLASISVSLTVTFTVERYIAVCHPMRGKLLCTESRAKIAIVIVYLLCFVSTITTPLEWGIHVTINVLDDNTTEDYIGLRPTELGVDETYQSVFYWFWSITFVFLPLILLSIFNSFLVHAVHSSRKTRCKMTQTDYSTNNQKQENRITITLIGVVLLFMVCQIPTAILLILRLLYRVQNHSKTDKLFRALGNIFNFLVTINAAANFLLYCALSARYRRTLVATFFKKLYTPPPANKTSIATQNFTQFKRSSSRCLLRDKNSISTHNNGREQTKPLEFMGPYPVHQISKENSRDDGNFE